MLCDSFLPLLSGHLDKQNSETEEKRLQQHLKTCKHCRALLAQMEKNDALLFETTPEPPAELTQRIMEQVRKQPRKTASRRRWISLGAGTLAAAALLALVLLQTIPLSPDKAASELTAAKTAVTATLDGSSEFYDTMELSEDAYQSQVAAGTAAVITTEAPLLPDAGITQSAEDGENTPEPTVAVTEPPPPPEETTVAAPPETTEESGRRKPPTHDAKNLTLSGPLMVIWSADAEIPDDLSMLEEIELSSSEAQAATFQQRFLTALLQWDLEVENPLMRRTDYPIFAYGTDYATFTKLTEALTGKYAFLVYLPVAETFENCTVLLIRTTQTEIESSVS